MIPQSPSDQSEDYQQHLREDTQHHPITSVPTNQITQLEQFPTNCWAYHEEWEVDQQNGGHSSEAHPLQHGALCGTETAAVVHMCCAVIHRHGEALPPRGGHLEDKQVQVYFCCSWKDLFQGHVCLSSASQMTIVVVCPSLFIYGNRLRMIFLFTVTVLQEKSMILHMHTHITFTYYNLNVIKL